MLIRFFQCLKKSIIAKILDAKKTRKKHFPQQNRFVSLPLSKYTETMIGQREDSNKPYGKPTQLPQPEVSKRHSPSRGRSIAEATVNAWPFQFNSIQNSFIETIPIITNYKNITEAADPQRGLIKTDK